MRDKRTPKDVCGEATLKVHFSVTEISSVVEFLIFPHLTVHRVVAWRH